LRGGVEEQRGGEFLEAEQIYARLIAERPDWPEVQHLLGTVYCQLGQWRLAIEWLAQAVSRSAPASWWCDYGLALLGAEEERAAQAAARRAVDLAPGDEESTLLLGSLLRRQNRAKEALSLYRDAVARSPRSARLRDRLGTALLSGGDASGAAAECTEACRLEPRNPRFLAHRGAALAEAWKMPEAIECLNRALALDPGDGEAAAHLAIIWSRLGDVDEAWRWACLAVTVRPQDLAVRAEAARTMHFVPSVTAEEIADVHRVCGALVRAPEAPRLPLGARRRLRVGYVSALFAAHATIFRAMLDCAPGQTYEVFCYADRFRPKPGLADGLPSMVSEWRDISGLTNAEVARSIRDDGIDVLVNCDGYLVVDRLPVFRACPARAQVALTLYPGTCGLETIRYRFTDPVLEPAGEFQLRSSEELLPLPTFACFTPPAAPDVTEPPSIRTGYVTFGSFSRLLKLNERVIAIWSRILKEAADSRLLIHTYLPTEAGATDGRPPDFISGRLLARFAAHGIASERIRIVGRLPLDRHLELYGSVDIALDPFPYNGMLTTLHALWMGVPVVALEGRTLAGRVGISHLTNAGMRHWVAGSEDAYVEKAVQAACERERLAAARAEMRQRIRQSALTDSRSYAAALAGAYRAMQ
jgi:predicted O-linked N-acetylglucosamine transferase (SPINDLY family)